MAAEVKSLFEGSWTGYKSENVEAMLENVGVSENLREIMLKNVPTTSLTVDGETITVSGTIGPRNYSSSFKLGEEYQIQGEYPSKAISTYANGQMTTVLTPNDKNKPQQTIVRTIVNGEMVQTMSSAGVVSTRYFKRS